MHKFDNKLSAHNILGAAYLAGWHAWEQGAKRRCFTSPHFTAEGKQAFCEGWDDACRLTGASVT